MDMKEPPTVRITVRENWTTERKYAWKINKWLAVAASEGIGYKVFRMDTGLPLIETIFEDYHMCIEFALWIAEKYKNKFDIWEAEPDWELLRIAHYSIPDGAEVYRIIEKVSSQKFIPSVDKT